MKKIVILFLVLFGLPLLMLVATMPPGILFLLVLITGVVIIQSRKRGVKNHNASIGKINTEVEGRMTRTRDRRNTAPVGMNETE